MCSLHLQDFSMETSHISKAQQLHVARGYYTELCCSRNLQCPSVQVFYTHYRYLKQPQGFNYDTFSSDSQILSGLELSPDIYSHTQLLKHTPNMSQNELLTSNQHTPLCSSPKHPHSSKQQLQPFSCSGQKPESRLTVFILSY